MTNENGNTLSIANFGLNLYKLRLERELTHDQLAELLGVSTRSVYGWESGKKKPGFQRAVEIANVLEASLDNILRSA